MKPKEIPKIIQSTDEIVQTWRSFKTQNKYLENTYKNVLLKNIKQISKKLKITIQLLFTPRLLKIILIEKIRLLKLSKTIIKYNDSFIESSLKENKSFFDGKDDNLKYPLDTDQRKAIIRNDKHNLVIAAAGSGKTSVLTSKIAYLIRKAYISPDKILALAFTKSAAQEMQERILKNFNININISTFHKFGRSIIIENKGSEIELFNDEDMNIKSVMHTLLLDTVKRKPELIVDYIEKYVLQEINFLITDKNKFINRFEVNHGMIHTWLKLDKKSLEGSITKYLNSSSKTVGNKDIHYKTITTKEFINTIHQFREATKEILKLCNSFVKHAKSNLLKPEDVNRRLRDKNYNQKQKNFGKLANEIYKNYERYLHDKGKIDFNDMINQGVELIKDNPEKYRNLYDYILIDEFQDISSQRMELIRSLVNTKSKTRLFCVGDDWQSIYQFTGSEVEFFVNFKNYFPNPAISHLSTNYRSSKKIISCSNELISYNMQQITKKVKAYSNKTGKIVLYEINNDSKYSNSIQIQHTTNLMQKLLMNGTKPEDIMVLSRFKKLLLSVQDKCRKNGLKILNQKNKSKGIGFYTAHSSKGLESKHVIVLNVVSGTYGFPCEIEDEQVLSPVKRSTDKRSYDEERRLFYVALTRAKENLYIYTQKGNRSRFINEIEDHIDKVEEVRYVTFENT